MGKIKDITGLVVGKLTATRFDKFHKGHTYWIFTCECGQEVSTLTGSLFQQKYQSCWDCRLGNKSHAWKGYGELPNEIVTMHKNSALVKNLEFNVDAKYLWELFESQNRKCVFTGFDLTFPKSSGNIKNR